LARRLALVAAVVAAALCLVPGAYAAQSIGATPYPQSITLKRFITSGPYQGLAVRFKGADGTQQEVRVDLPYNYQTTRSRLTLYANDAPANTEYKTCLEYTGSVPLGSPDFNPLTCMVLTRSGFISFLVQAVAKRVKDFGGTTNGVLSDIYVSARPSVDVATKKVYPNPDDMVYVPFITTYRVPGLPDALTDPASAILTAFPRWSKFYSGSLKESANKHFPVLFGSLTFAGVGVYGPGDRYGAPTNQYGRNIYIDTLDSDYGKGWHRIMGVLTQPTNGTFCYEFSKKGGSNGKTGVSTSNTYRLTAIGPGLTPVVRVAFQGPTFPFANASYNPLTNKWGTNFSPEQASALRQQALMMGPEWRRKVKGTDCAQTLRQLPESFFTQQG